MRTERSDGHKALEIPIMGDELTTCDEVRWVAGPGSEPTH